MHFRYFHLDPRLASGKSSPFDTLFDLFQQLVSISGGDVSQALRWLTQLDREYGISDSFETPMGIGEFIQELKDRGYIRFDDQDQVMVPTAKTGRSIRKRSLDEIFRHLKKGGAGNHATPHSGRGSERQPETRPWKPGEDISAIDPVGTITNMLRHSNLDALDLQESDLEVYDQDHHTSNATVLLIDLSHSMVLYGEDRITPAKKVAMALSELVTSRYAKDSLEIVAFGNQAWRISMGDLPFLKVGPYHTNTLHGLQVARHILERRKFANKQIFMITDGKPSCMFDGDRLYKNSFGLDRKIVNKVLDEAVVCRRSQIRITTFMIAQDPYLQNFVRELTEANHGRAYFASLGELGGFVFEDYIRNRRKRMM